MHDFDQSKLKIVHTVITEFRTHLGKYWRDCIDREKLKIIVVTKSFDEEDALVIVPKTLFDQITSRALRIPYEKVPHPQTTEIRRVLHGPHATEQTLKEIVQNRILAP